MPENQVQDLFDIDLTETAIQDIAPQARGAAISADGSCFRTCTTCAIC